KQRRLRKSEASSVANHEERQSAEESEMKQRGGRVPSERERHEKQHFRSLREIGVHAMEIPVEPVVAKGSGHVSQVIAAAVGTHLRRHRIKKVVDAKRAKYHKKQD